MFSECRGVAAAGGLGGTINCGVEGVEGSEGLEGLGKDEEDLMVAAEDIG